MSNTLVNFLVYNATLQFLENFEELANADFLVAQFFGFVVSVFWSFCMNRKFVFISPEERAVPWHKALIKMYLAYSFTGVGLNSILSLGWEYVFGIPKEFFTLINDVIGLPANFLLNKFWSFR